MKRRIGFTCGDVEILKEYIGKGLNVNFEHHLFEFIENNGGKIYHRDGYINQYHVVELLQVDTSGIVIMTNGEDAQKLRIELHEKREKNAFLHSGERKKEEYSLHIVDISYGAKIIIRMNSKDFLPKDVKEKIQTHKFVHSHIAGEPDDY